MKLIQNIAVYFVLSLFSLVAFGQKDVITVKGNLIGSSSSDKVLLLKEIEGKLAVVDTSLINSKGDFTFTVKSNIPDFYLLKFEPNVQQYAYLVLHPKQTVGVQLQIDGNEIEYKAINGSEEMALMKTVLDILSNTKNEIARLQKEHETAEDKALVEKRFNQVVMSSQQTIKEKLLANKNMLASAVLVTVLDFENEFAIYEEIAQVLGKKYPNNSEVAKLVKKVRVVNGIVVGKPVPEIELANTEGKTMTLSSLRGKYVLIDFWASWCRPCRMENPNVVALYNKYHTKGFDIFSVSLDKNKDSWINAIATDGLVWKNHVSDLQQWQSVVVPLYGVQGIPFTVLIDKEGKTIAKGLRGDELKAKLAELLGE